MTIFAFWGSPLEFIGMLGRELLRVVTGKSKPWRPLRCQRCGYATSPRTVLIPQGRCPSCGAPLEET